MKKIANSISKALLLSLCLAALGIAAGCSKGKKLVHLNRAESYFKKGDNEKARIEYLKVLRYDYTNLVAIRQLGTMAYSDGETRAAYAYLNKVKELDPNDWNSRLRLCQILDLAGQNKDAHAEALAILQHAPDTDEAILMLAETIAKPEEIATTRKELQGIKAKIGERASLLTAEGDLLFQERKPPEAEAQYDKAIALDAKYAPAQLRKARLALGRNDVEHANQFFLQAVAGAKDKARTEISYIDFKMRTAPLPEAKKALEEFRKKNPRFIPGLVYAADIAFREKQYDDCSKLCDQILTRDELNYDAHLYRARIRLVKGEFEPGIKELENLAQVYPKNPQLLFISAQAYLAANQLAKAVNSLRQAIAVAPQFSDAILLLSELNIRQGDYPTAIASLRALLKTQPQVARAYELLAAAYVGRKSPQEALQVYSDYNKAFPKSTTPLLLTGGLYRQTGDLKKARTFFEEVLKTNPDDLAAMNQLIELDIAEKSYDKALARSASLTAKMPKSALPHLLAAKVYLAQNDFAKSEATLLKAIETEPMATQSYILLSRLYVSAHKEQQALEKLAQVTAKTPDNMEAWMQTAAIQEQSKNYKAAVEAYKKVLTLKPQFGPALNNLAYLYAEHLDLTDAAFELAKQARELMPYDPSVADTFGWVLYRKGDLPRALATLKEVAEQLRAQPEALYHLGMVYYAMGEEAAAAQAFSSAFQLSKDFPGHEQSAEKLALLNLKTASADPAVVAALEKAVKENPNDVIALTRLGDVMQRTGKSDRALQLYEGAIKANKNAPAPLVKLAQVYAEKLHDPKKALEPLKTARMLSPTDPQIAQLLGKVQYELGNYTAAFDLLQEAAKNSPSPDLLVDLALVQYQVGQIDASMATMRQAIAAGGANLARAQEANRFTSLVALYQNPANPAEAKAQAAQALKSDPKYLPALMLSAAASEQSNNRAEATQTLQKVLEINPAFFPAQKRLAILLAGTDDKKAVEIGTKARMALPDDTELARAVGLAAYRLGDYRAAVPLLTQTSIKAPKDSEALYTLGAAHFYLKQSRESKDVLNRALILDANNKLAPEARKILAQLK